MPRRHAQDNVFTIKHVSGIDDILTALGDSKITNINVVDKLEEATRVLKSTHLGHELYLWEQEVDEVE